MCHHVSCLLFNCASCWSWGGLYGLESGAKFLVHEYTGIPKVVFLTINSISAMTMASHFLLQIRRRVLAWTSSWKRKNSWRLNYACHLFSEFFFCYKLSYACHLFSEFVFWYYKLNSLQIYWMLLHLTAVNYEFRFIICTVVLLLAQIQICY